MSERGNLLLAVVTNICDEDVTYPSCHKCCGKLFLDQLSCDQRFCCLKCGSRCCHDSIQWRYRLVMTIADGDVTGKVVVFGGTLNGFFGKTASDFHRSLRDLGKSGYPAEAMLSDALIKTFHGKYFYFGFKTRHNSDSGPLTLKDVLSISVHTNDHLSKESQDKETFHTLAYQMVSGNDGIYATVTDHMRYAVRTLQNTRNGGVLQEPVPIVQVKKEAWVSHNNSSTLTESEFDNSSFCALKSFRSKQTSVMFSFENDTSDMNSRDGYMYVSDKSMTGNKNNSTTDGKDHTRTFNEVHAGTVSKSCTKTSYKDHTWTGFTGHKGTFENGISFKNDVCGISESPDERITTIHVHGALYNCEEDSCSESYANSQNLFFSPLGQYTVTQKLDFSDDNEFYNTDNIDRSFQSSVAASSESEGIDVDIIAENQIQQNNITVHVAVGNYTSQNIYLPESEDLEAFLDTFEEESEENNTKNITQNVNDAKTMILKSEDYFVSDDIDLESEQIPENSFYDNLCESSINIKSNLHLKSRCDDTVENYSPPPITKELYLPESEDIEEFLKSFEEEIGTNQWLNACDTLTGVQQNSVYNVDEKFSKDKPCKVQNETILLESHEYSPRDKLIAIPNHCATLQEQGCMWKCGNGKEEMDSFDMMIMRKENNNETKSLNENVEDDSGFCQQVEVEDSSKERKTLNLENAGQFSKTDHFPVRELEFETKPIIASKELDTHGMKKSQESQGKIEHMAYKELKETLCVNDSELEVFFADISLDNVQAKGSVQAILENIPSKHCTERLRSKETEYKECTTPVIRKEIVTSNSKLESLDKSKTHNAEECEEVNETFKETNQKNNVKSGSEDLIDKNDEYYKSGSEDLIDKKSCDLFDYCIDHENGNCKEESSGNIDKFEETFLIQSGDLFYNALSCDGKNQLRDTNVNDNSNSDLSSDSSICELDRFSCSSTDMVTESQDIFDVKVKEINCVREAENNQTDSPVLSKRVQFEKRLQKVTSCHLLDLKMKFGESPLDKLKMEFCLKPCLKTRDVNAGVVICDSAMQGKFNTNTRDLTVCFNGHDDIADNYLIVENDHAGSETEANLSDIGGSQDLFGPSPVSAVETRIENERTSDLITYAASATGQTISNSKPSPVCCDTGTPDIFKSQNEISHPNQIAKVGTAMTPDIFSPEDKYDDNQVGKIFSEEECIAEQVTVICFDSVSRSKTKCRGKHSPYSNKPLKGSHLFKCLVENTPDSGTKNKGSLQQQGSFNKPANSCSLPCNNRLVIREAVVNYEESPDLFASSADTANTSETTGIEYLRALSKNSELCKQLFF